MLFKTDFNSNFAFKNNIAFFFCKWYSQLFDKMLHTIVYYTWNYRKQLNLTL